MSNGLRDYSGLFSLLTNNKPDEMGTVLQKIGTISFAVGLAGGAFAQFASLVHDTSGSNQEPTLPFLIAVGVFASGSLFGLFMFLATAIHYIGRENGKTSFLRSTAYVLGRTFLYVFFPSIIIAAIIITWAIVTHQPAFQ